MLSLVLMHEMAPFAIVADAYYVEIAAELRFVLGVAAEVSEFVVAVSKLTFISVFTGAALLERPAQLGLVAARVDGSLALSRFGAVAEAPVQLAVRERAR